MFVGPAFAPGIQQKLDRLGAELEAPKGYGQKQRKPANKPALTIQHATGRELIPSCPPPLSDRMANPESRGFFSFYLTRREIFYLAPLVTDQHDQLFFDFLIFRGV